MSHVASGVPAASALPTRPQLGLPSSGLPVLDLVLFAEFVADGTYFDQFQPDPDDKSNGPLTDFLALFSRSLTDRHREAVEAGPPPGCAWGEASGRLSRLRDAARALLVAQRKNALERHQCGHTPWPTPLPSGEPMLLFSHRFDVRDPRQCEYTELVEAVERAAQDVKDYFPLRQSSSGGGVDRRDTSPSEEGKTEDNSGEAELQRAVPAATQTPVTNNNNAPPAVAAPFDLLLAQLTKMDFRSGKMIALLRELARSEGWLSLADANAAFEGSAVDAVKRPRNKNELKKHGWQLYQLNNGIRLDQLPTRPSPDA